MIGALKTNHNISAGIRAQAREFAAYVHETDVVTLGHESYRVYHMDTFSMKSNKLPFSYAGMQKTQRSQSGISTDTELSTEQILSYYSQHGGIGVYFKSSKE